MTDQELLDTLSELERRMHDSYSSKPILEAMYAVIDVYRRTSRSSPPIVLPNPLNTPSPTEAAPIYAQVEAIHTYAQALRDLYEAFQPDSEFSDICNHNAGAREVISRLASRRGICLEDES